MVNIDLSKVLPHRAHEYLAGFLPGLFFVFSVALANPVLVARLSDNSKHSLDLTRYETIGLALFLAFVAGNGFLLVDTLIQYVLGLLYPFKLFLYRQICNWPFRRITQWLLTKPRFRRPWVSKFHQHVVITSQLGFEESWRQNWNCWMVFARRLLRIRFGIDPEDIDEGAWGVIYQNLGVRTPEDLRGVITMIAVHATGWAGIVATGIAPSLRNRYYVGFCLFLILNGLLHDYYVVKGHEDPRVSPRIAIQAVLREFPKLERANVQPSAPPEK